MSLHKPSEHTAKHIEGFQVTFPERRDYFGKMCEATEESSLKKGLGSGDQSSLFDEEAQLIVMSVSDYVLAHKCPKVFKGYFIDGYPSGPPHHKLFDVGTTVDRVAREYLRFPIEVRAQKRPLLRDQLSDKVSKLSQDDIFSRKLLDAFDDFCAHFKATKLATDFDSNKKLVFEFGDFLLGGKIDFLIREEDNTLTLLDLKLLSVGNGVDNLEFHDVIQALLYAYALLNKSIEVTRTGYYYFLERTFVLQELPVEIFDRYIRILKEFAFSLARTKEFIPRRCANCLICQLRAKCEIGRKTASSDFAYPIE